jgi:hypothetical protein
MLNGILKDRVFHPKEKIKKAIASAWNDLTFDDVQSLLYNWMSCLHRPLRIVETLPLNK